MVGRMIDLHTHILPALDDGPATLAESIGMARTAAAEGITTVVATPHVRDDYPTPRWSRPSRRSAMPCPSRGSSSRSKREGEIALDRLELLDDDQLGASPSAERTTRCSSALTVAGRSTSPRRLFRCT
jgi:hypothetical protein